MIGPLLEHAQADCAGLDLAAKVDVPVQIARIHVCGFESRVMVAPRLLVLADLLPSVLGCDIDFLAVRARVGVDLGHASIDLTDRQAADRLRFLPLELVYARVSR